MGGRIRVGCTGWSYEDWRGGFYPAQCDPGEFLERYVRVFNTAEIDSTFYHTPDPSRAQRWATTAPDGFEFCPKLPRTITHEGPIGEAPEALRRFERGIRPLRDAGRLGPIVAQFPPSFRYPEGAERLRLVLEGIPAPQPLAVELRHRSWWADAALGPLEGRRAALVWSVRPGARAPLRATGEFLYVRFVGDRALTEFDRIQRDGRAEMESLRDQLLREGFDSLRVYALVNNHYMGFGPGTAQILREVLGLPPLDLTAAARTIGQTSLADFGAPGGGAR